MSKPHKIIAIHQPNFMPWSGYVHKIMSSDFFVLMDNVQFSKESWINRVQIKTNQGPLWISVPVKTSHKLQQTIGEVEICNNTKWGIKILRTLEMNYRKTPFWNDHSPFIEDTFSRQWRLLIDLNIHCLNYFKQALNIKTQFVLLSSLSVSGKKSSLLCEVCKNLGATVYLSGAQAAEYNDPKLFEEYQIKLSYQNFKHPIYSQPHGEFSAGLSVLDLLLNCGTESKKLIQDANILSR